jgi:hypothetical protein
MKSWFRYGVLKRSISKAIATPKKKPGTKTGITLAGLVQGGKTRGI